MPYIIKLQTTSSGLDTGATIPLATRDPNGNALVGWSITATNASTLVIGVPSGLIGCLYGFSRMVPGTGQTLVAAISVAATTGQFISLVGSNYTINNFTSVLSGITTAGSLYILFNAGSSTMLI